MEGVTVVGFVVHGIEHDALGFFGLVAIDARSGGHVKAFCTPDGVVVVHFDEGGFFLSFEGGAGGAVRFVADDEVKIRQAVCRLCLMNDVDGMVGGVGDGHVCVVMSPLGGVVKAFGAGSGGVGEFAAGDEVGIVFFFFADFAVGTDGEVVQRQFAILCPFAQGLVEQGEAGDEEEDAFTASGDLLGNAQGGEGFAGTAGHDEFAARFAACVAARHVAQRFFLVRAQGFLVFERRGLPALVASPINFAFFQVAQGDGADGGLLAVQRVSSVFRPVVGGRNDNAVAEIRFAGSGEKAVDIFFLQGVISGVVFALDGVIFAVMGGGDEVNTRVAGAAQMQFIQMGGCPCGVGLHGTVEVAVLRFSLEVVQHQALKGGTLVADGRAFGAEAGEEVLQGGHGVFFRGGLIKVLSRVVWSLPPSGGVIASPLRVLS